MLRLLPVTPAPPDHCSRIAQPSAITSIRLSAAFLPDGTNTSQWPTQKSNCRCSTGWHDLPASAAVERAPYPVRKNLYRRSMRLLTFRRPEDGIPAIGVRCGQRVLEA